MASCRLRGILPLSQKMMSAVKESTVRAAEDDRHLFRRLGVCCTCSPCPRRRDNRVVTPASNAHGNPQVGDRADCRRAGVRRRHVRQDTNPGVLFCRQDTGSAPHGMPAQAEMGQITADTTRSCLSLFALQPSQAGAHVLGEVGVIGKQAAGRTGSPTTQQPPSNRQMRLRKPQPIQDVTTPLDLPTASKLDVVGFESIARCKSQPQKQLHKTASFVSSFHMPKLVTFGRCKSLFVTVGHSQPPIKAPEDVELRQRIFP